MVSPTLKISTGTSQPYSAGRAGLIFRGRPEYVRIDPRNTARTPNMEGIDKLPARMGDQTSDKPPNKESVFHCKVYYEDTDCMSVVYHANYAKYMERARTEFVADRLSNIESYHDSGFFFMVHKLEMAFHAPARLGDMLAIRTWIENTTKYRVVVRQIITRQGEPRDYLVTGTVTLVTVNPDGELLPVPGEFHEL